MRTKWEYEFYTVTPGIDNDTLFTMLRRYGEDGWELIHITTLTYYFKRPKVDPITKHPQGKRKN